MKRILYLLPFIILVSCKQTRFVCNQQLIATKTPVALAATITNDLVDSSCKLNNLQSIVAASPNQIESAEKRIRKKIQKISTVFHQPNSNKISPNDSSIKDPGLQKAKDAMDDEGNWITAYFVFWGLLILFALTLLGVISFGIFLSEEILSLLLVICAAGILASFIGSIFKIRKNKTVVEGYPTEESRYKTHRRILLFMIFVTCCL